LKRKDYDTLQNSVQLLLNKVNKFSNKIINKKTLQIFDQKNSITKNCTNTLFSLIHINNETVKNKKINHASIQNKLKKMKSTTTSNYETSSMYFF
jgi:GTPase involved in cell partitioning and DNA repair